MERGRNSLSQFTLLCICGTVLCLLMMIAGVGLANHGLKKYEGISSAVI